jgi:hypothetical protein
MENKDILKLVVLIAVGIMVGGMFAPALFFPSGNSGNGDTSGDTISGVVQFNGSIRTYEPVLLVSGSIPDSLKNELLLDKRVTGITPSSGGILINLSSRDAVYPIANNLSEQGISSASVANVILPSSVEMSLMNGSKINVFASGAIQITTQPYVDTDTEVVVRMSGSAQNGRLISYTSPIILADYVNVSVNGTIQSILEKQYKFSIPWESREQVNASTYANAHYDRADYISFPQGLSVEQITQMAKLPYITYITDVSATVNESFADKSKLQSDFGNITIVFPDSTLVINSNDSVSLPYNGSLLNSYVVELPSSVDGYNLPNKSFNLSSTNEYSVNESVNVAIVGKGIGDKIVKIDSISID